MSHGLDALPPDNAGQPPRHPEAPFNSFLKDARLQFGPLAVLGRYLLSAEGAFEKHGIALALRPVAEMPANATSDGALHPPAPSASSAFCVIGRAADGGIVAAQASSLFTTGNRPFAAFLRDAELKGVANLPGTVAYSSGLWLAPRYRGHNLGAVLARLTRAVAVGRWRSGTMATILPLAVAGDKLRQHLGYRQYADGATQGADGHPVACALAWLDVEQVLHDLDDVRLRIIAPMFGPEPDETADDHDATPSAEHPLH